MSPSLRLASSTPASVEGIELVGLDPRTVAYVRVILSRAFKDAVRWGRLTRNPAEAADPPRTGSKAAEMTWDAASTDPTFPSGLRPDATRYALVRRVERYGFPRLNLHSVRHPWATIALEQGIHPRVVQERLGHSTIAVTRDLQPREPQLHAQKRLDGGRGGT